MVLSMTQHEWEALGEAEAAFTPEGEWEGAPESEWETELENEWESEFESPGDARQVALETAKSESEQEAVESFLPLVPMLAGKILPLAAKMAPKLAGKIIPRMARHVTRVSPTLSRGISGIARKLYRNPGTRSLLRAVPSIAQRTMRRIAHQAAVGRPITARSALRTLAQQTYRVLSHPGARSRRCAGITEWIGTITAARAFRPPRRARPSGSARRSARRDRLACACPAARGRSCPSRAHGCKGAACAAGAGAWRDRGDLRWNSRRTSSRALKAPLMRRCPRRRCARCPAALAPRADDKRHASRSGAATVQGGRIRHARGGVVGRASAGGELAHREPAQRTHAHDARRRRIGERGDRGAQRDAPASRDDAQGEGARMGARHRKDLGLLFRALRPAPEPLRRLAARLRPHRDGLLSGRIYGARHRQVDSCAAAILLHAHGLRAPDVGTRHPHVEVRPPAQSISADPTAVPPARHSVDARGGPARSEPQPSIGSRPLEGRSEGDGLAAARGQHGPAGCGDLDALEPRDVLRCLGGAARRPGHGRLDHGCGRARAADRLCVQSAGVHPPPYLRILISVEVLRRMGFADDAEQIRRAWTRNYPNPRSGGLPKPLLDTFPQAVRLAVDTMAWRPYAALGRRSLAQVFRFAPKEQRIIEEAAERLAAGNDPGIVPERFLIGAARFALDRKLARPGVIAENFYKELARR